MKISNYMIIENTHFGNKTKLNCSKHGWFFLCRRMMDCKRYSLFFFPADSEIYSPDEGQWPEGMGIVSGKEGRKEGRKEGKKGHWPTIINLFT
jgi:hypothetical protein